MYIVLAILGVSLLVILHELGHFIFARAFDMRVLRFSIGFGPTLLSHQRGENTWQIAALPFGGFVQIDGMGLRQDDVVDDERNFRNKPAWQRAIVILAGPATNWLVAAILVAALGMTAGVAVPTKSATIGVVGNETAAERAGLRAGDTIVAVNGIELSTWSELVDQIQAHAKIEITLRVLGDGKELEFEATPDLGASGGLLGVGPMTERRRYGVIESLRAGVAYSWQGSVQITQLLWGMIAGTRDGQLSGVPGIIRAVSSEAQAGIDRWVQMLAWLSVTLCVLNLAPLPAVDGGRLLFIVLEAARGQPAPERLEATIHGVGMLLLLGLAVFLSIRDLL